MRCVVLVAIFSRFALIAGEPPAVPANHLSDLSQSAMTLTVKKAANLTDARQRAVVAQLPTGPSNACRKNAHFVGEWDHDRPAYGLLHDLYTTVSCALTYEGSHEVQTSTARLSFPLRKLFTGFRAGSAPG